MSPKPSRNDPCPCGSKRKYKNCCGRKGFRLDSRLFKRIFLWVILIAAAAWAGKQYVFVTDTEDVPVNPLSSQQTKRVQPLTPQPPGPVPEGKVWSAEHGHWHDAGNPNPDGEQKRYPKPPGLTPPGKVWSYEHGHWHDSSYTGTESYTPGPPPPGPAPEGKVWSYEHGHWHDSKTTQKIEVKDGKSRKITVGNEPLRPIKVDDVDEE